MTLKEFFIGESIFEYSVLPFGEVSVINPGRLSRIFGESECLTVVPFLIPYFVREEEKGNVSIYARSRDYHFYFKQLAQRAKLLFPELSASCDNSPINEVECAVKAGLGSIGKNGLLLNPRYGSYVFIAEFFFSLPLHDPVFDGIEPRRGGEICLNCGACERACPMNALDDKSRCISYINQKKRLDDGDEKIIADSGSVWGCDICQNVCPYNIHAEETQIEFFRQNRTPRLTEELLDTMLASGELAQRAYAWRGEETLRRNLRICPHPKNALQ